MEPSTTAPAVPKQLALIDLGFAEVTPVGLAVYRPEPEWRQMQHAFEVLTVSHQADQWSLGDWWILAFAVFGEDASQLVSASRIPRKTLQNYAWVARKFLKVVGTVEEYEALRDLMPLTADPDHPLRRRMALSFSHHSAVAGLVGETEKGEALAVALLDRCETDPEMSVEDLEEAVRQFRGTPNEDEAEEPDEGEVSFTVGTIPARLERTHGTVSRIREELPKSWRPERKLLSDAMASLETCNESIRNRDAGGKPAIR